MPGGTVRLGLPRGPLFVGTYARVPVSIPSGLGIAFDDLEFAIPAGTGAGQVSSSREASFDPLRPEIMLLVGYEPGLYEIRVIESRTRTVVGKQKFEVTGMWPDQTEGPAFWFAGAVKPYSFGAWGGGPAGPQNMKVYPAPATWKLAAVMIDFDGQRFPTDPAILQGFRDDWYKDIVTGVVASGANRSVQRYYREVSYGKFEIIHSSVDMYGPVNLTGVWTDYFIQIPDGRWLVNDWQTLVTGVQAALDLTAYDALLFISHKGAPDPADKKMLINGVMTAVPRFAWGSAHRQKAPFTTNRGALTLGVVSMANEWRSFGGTYAHATLAHELGHTLGLDDQYYNPASLASRKAGDWEVMASGDDAMPQFSLAHRMMLGWVDPAALVPLDFAQAIGPVNQLITLSPAELPPSAGGKLGIEVRIADGLNYYFEYRKTQAGQSGDQMLSWSRDNVVLGTDVASSPPPRTRSQILVLDGKPTGLGNGENYEEVDRSNTAWPGTFRAEVSGITGTTADVRIIYGVNGKPDPAIRPWPAGPNRPWQSPDIEVQNLRSQQDPAAWFNVPWLAHTNTVVARVTNRGNIPAPGVRVDFFVKDYTVTNAPETSIGSDVHDLTAGQAVDFKTTWTPSAAGHYCVVARIALYAAPMAPDLTELTSLNNTAQSNYDRFISATGSPARRVVSSVTVQNPYPQATRVFIAPGQTNPLYRTYLEHTWIELRPGESRAVEVMFEYAPTGNSDRDAVFGAANLRKFAARPNDVSVVGLIQDPEDRHILRVWGGVQAQIVTGKDTRIEGLKAGKTFVRGRVLTSSDRKPVSGGKVLVTLWTGRGKRRKEVASFPVPVRRGDFEAKIEQKWSEIEAYFLPPPGLGDCSAMLVE